MEQMCFSLFWYILILFVLTIAVFSPLRVSNSYSYLKSAKGEKPKISMLGYAFNKCWSGSALLGFLSALFVLLWSLLFIIPGIIKAYSYSMSTYIMAEDPSISSLDAITKSKEMMKGHKFELFVLDLSFIFWHLLGSITFGFAYIYIFPYIEATKANFYLKLKEK